MLVARYRPQFDLTLPEGQRLMGIVGGIASGKSAVAKLLSERGAEVLDADVVAHRILDRQAIQDRVAEAFGDDVVNEDGTINRPALGTKVFSDAQALHRLNQIVHPPIIEEMRRIILDSKADLVVLDAALLMETGLHLDCDITLYLDVSDETRRERAASTRGWAPEEVDRREGHQMSLEEKRNKATYIIRNDGDLEETAAQIDQILQDLR